MKKEDHNQSLLRKLEQLSAQQNKLQREIEVLRSEISKEIEVEKADEKALADEILQTFEKLPLQQPELPPIPVEPNINKATTKDSAKKRIDFERFIGENLISKIGIVIIIIGVGIGAKYAIENQLVSPLIRIIIGYFIGVFMGIIAIRLRGRYLNFSAVLLSGAIAILYFITYAAYSYYSMMPQLVAFILMLLFTSGAVYTALSYNQQVIAHFGLVGAYAVPLLLSDNTGNVLILFSYVGIINLGILFLSIKKYWKPLYYLSFIVTWLLFVSWQIESFKSTDLFVGSFFAYLFFIIFYVAFLSYKVIKREQFGWADLLLVLSNSFVFYAVGYSLAGEFDSSYSLGIFTLSNALLHFIVYLAIYSRRNIDKNLRRLAMSIAIVFLVIAVPVQLDGSWVTLLWIGMALSLFYVGRTNKNWVYEGLSYPLLALSFLSILHDWLHASADNLSIVFNVYFLATLLYILALGAIFYINRKYSLLENSKLVTWQDPIEIVATVGMIISVYFLFVFEINRYWNTTGGSDLYYQRGLLIQISDLIYAIALVAGFQYLNFFRFKSKRITTVGVFVSSLLLLFYLVSGLLLLSQLRAEFLSVDPDLQISAIAPGWVFLYFRYFTYLVVIPFLWVNYHAIKRDISDKNIPATIGLVLHLSVLWILSSELLHWMDFFNFSDSYKGALSLLWGAYAVFLVVLGIRNNAVYFRVAGIGIFAVTLAKLFLYDIADLPTLSKTIIFLVLGGLLLVISFIYIKFRDKLWGSDDKN